VREEAATDPAGTATRAAGKAAQRGHQAVRSAARAGGTVSDTRPPLPASGTYEAAQRPDVARRMVVAFARGQRGRAGHDRDRPSFTQLVRDGERRWAPSGTTPGSPCRTCRPAPATATRDRSLAEPGRRDGRRVLAMPKCAPSYRGFESRRHMIPTIVAYTRGSTSTDVLTQREWLLTNGIAIRVGDAGRCSSPALSCLLVASLRNRWAAPCAESTW